MADRAMSDEQKRIEEIGKRLDQPIRGFPDGLHPPDNSPTRLTWQEEIGLPAPPPAPDTGGEGNWTKPAARVGTSADGVNAAPSPAREHGLTPMLNGFTLVCLCGYNPKPYTPEQFNAHLRAEVWREMLEEVRERWINEPSDAKFGRWLREQSGKE